MSELLREIEEDIRRERFDKIWKSIGRIAVWGSIGVIAATTVFVIWDNHARKEAEAKTSQLLKGDERLSVYDYKGASSAFSVLTDDDSSPYYGLAMLHKAEAQEQGGDVEGAEKTYAVLAKKNEGKNKSEFSELAALKYLKPGETIKAAKTSPFYHTIAERNAWQLLQSDKKSEASAIFAELLGDGKTPPAMALRAKEALRVIAPEKLSEKRVINE